MWKCGSTKGGETRQPEASMTRPASAVDRRLDRGDRLAVDADVGGLAVGQDAALDEEVETHLSPFW